MRSRIKHNWLALAICYFAIAGGALADWAHWRGPHRNGVVDEPSGYEIGAWPLKQARWHAQVGEGGSSPLVADRVVLVMGWQNNQEQLLALDTDTGQERWRQAYPAPRYSRYRKGDESMYSGVTATPEYDPETGYVYTLGTDGDLQCWDTQRKGARIWGMNLFDTYGHKQRPKLTRQGHRDYGYTTSPLVFEDQLIVEVGAPEGLLIGYDKRNGTQRWISSYQSFAGHTGGPALMRVEGVPCIATLCMNGLVVIRIDPGHEGETVAEVEWKTDYANSIASPGIFKNAVVITSHYNKKAMARYDIRLKEGATEVWRVRHASKVCSPLIADGKVFWSWTDCNAFDFNTGKALWSSSGFGTPGSMVYTSDQRLIVWSKAGDLSLIDPNNGRTLSQVNNLFGRDVWPHLAFADQQLYLKDRGGNLRCYRLEKGTPPSVEKKVSHEQPVPRILLQFDRNFKQHRRLEARGDAQHTTGGYLRFNAGGMAIDGYSPLLLDNLRRSNEMTIEALLVSEHLDQHGPARIISFSKDAYHRNFTLGQEKDQLTLRLRTSDSDSNGKKFESVLGRIEAGKMTHLLVSYRPGELTAYINGKQTLHRSRVRGDFSTWEPMHLILGDEWDGARPWQGALAQLQIENRATDEKTAAERFRNRSAK